MKAIKNLSVAVLLLCMMLSLCACGGNDTVQPQPTETEAVAVETTEAPVAEETLAAGMAVYTVTVVDEGGNPIVGAMVQLCKDSCVPNVTDENGVATFTLPEDDYKASMMTMPAGYEYVEEAEAFYFDDGSYELTIVLKAVA